MKTIEQLREEKKELEKGMSQLDYEERDMLISEDTKQIDLFKVEAQLNQTKEIIRIIEIWFSEMDSSWSLGIDEIEDMKKELLSKLKGNNNSTL